MTDGANLRRESDARTLGELVSTVASLVAQVQSISDRLERLSELMESRYQRKDLAEAQAAGILSRVTDLAETIRDVRRDQERCDNEERQARERSVAELWEKRDEDAADRAAQRRWLIAAVVIPIVSVFLAAAGSAAAIILR